MQNAATCVPRPTIDKTGVLIWYVVIPLYLIGSWYLIIKFGVLLLVRLSGLT